MSNTLVTTGSSTRGELSVDAVSDEGTRQADEGHVNTAVVALNRPRCKQVDGIAAGKR